MTRWGRGLILLLAMAAGPSGSVWSQTPPATTPTPEAVPAAPPAAPPPAAAETIPGEPPPAPVQVPPPESTPPGAPSTVTLPETKGAAPGGEVPLILPEGVSGEMDKVYLNVTDEEITEVIKQISRATGRNFIITDKIRGKVTIISERPMTQEEVYQAFLSALEVAGYTTVTTPAGMIKVVPLRDSISEPIETYTGEHPITDNFITRLITLQNISALDMSNVVKGLVSKDGNLFAYPATNTLIVTDTGSNIDRIIKIIKELDREGPQETLEIIPIKNAKARDIADKVLKIYEQEKGPARKGGPQEEAPVFSKVIADERTNSLIVLASKRALEKVKDLIAQLDVPLPTAAEGNIHVHYLRFADAEKMATTLSTLAQAAEQAKKAQEGGGPGGAGGVVVAGLEGGIKITADKSTNALIITASPKDYESLVDKVISKLDIPRRQVFVEAIIMELAIDQSRTLGVSGTGGKTVSVGGQQLPIFGSTGAATGGSSALLTSTLGGLAAGTFSSKTVGLTLTNTDGTTRSVTLPAFASLLTAIQSDSNVNVLSTPNLLTLDNEEAQIVVARKEPFSTGTTTTTGGVVTQSFTREDVGITLKIKPQINESDTVKLNVHQEVSALVASAGQGPLAATAGPSTTKRSVDSAVVASDGQTIVLGGLIEDRFAVIETKVPFLGDIPILGYLFKTRTRSKVRTNLIVFLTPHIIRDSSDFLRILKNKIDERNAFIERNYGRSQQREIRNSLRYHARQLLELGEEIRSSGEESAGPVSETATFEPAIPPSGQKPK